MTLAEEVAALEAGITAASRHAARPCEVVRAREHEEQVNPLIDLWVAVRDGDFGEDG